MTTKLKSEKGFKGVGCFFKSIGSKISAYFKSLRPLVMMQLKDKLELNVKSKKKLMFKTVYTILRFAVVTILINLLFNLVVMFGIFSYIKTLNFRAFLVLMTVILMLSFIACVVSTTNTLYFSKDNLVLITMPVKNSTIFTSKLIVCFIYELIKNITYILPFLIAYGITMNLSMVYFAWAIFSVLIFTLLCVSLSGLLSIPTMYLFILFKKNKIIEYLFTAAIVAVISYSVVKLISFIPEDIDLVRDWGGIYWAIQDFLKSFATNFVVFAYLLELMTGMRYNSYAFSLTGANFLSLLMILGIIVVCFVLIYVLSKPLFLRMISTPFEYKKKEKIKNKKNKKLPAFISAVKTQFKIIFRSSNVMYNVLAVAVITPIAIYLQNKIIGAMDTRILGNYMGITFNILIVLLMTLSSNSSIASVFSREGNSAYLNKVNPVPYIVPLTAKITFNASVNIISIITSSVVIQFTTNLTLIQTLLLCLTLVFVYIAHLCWSAELDIMNPQNHQYQTTGESQKNPNENHATLYGFLLSAVFAFLTFFLMNENIEIVFIKLLIVSALIMAARVWLYVTKVKLYYKEK